MKFNTRYNLRRQKSAKPEKIYLVCRFNNAKFVYPTSFNILPKNWHVKNGEVRNVIQEINRDEINIYLRELKKEAKSIYETAIIKKVPIAEIKTIIKNGLDKWTGKTVDIKPVFWNYVNAYINDSNKRIDPKTGRLINKRTIQQYSITPKALHDFEKENKEIVDFENIGINTLIDFRDYLTTVKRYEVKDKATKETVNKAYSINMIAKHIDNVRQFLRAANADKIYFDVDIIDSKKFTNAREAAYNVYLNESELLQIENIDLSNNNRLDKARDLFLIGCFTGLRISDYNNIKPHNIKKGFIDIYQTKTGQRIVIPIHEAVQSIIDKYDGKTPPKISDQKLNEYIKEVCKMAGIIEQTEKQQTKGGEKVATIKSKWEMVSSHTARRTFATNMTRQGIPIQTIMQITGHKQERTFLKYVKLSANEHAEIMAKHWKTANLNTA